MDDSCQKLLQSGDANFIENIGNLSNKKVSNVGLQTCSDSSRTNSKPIEFGQSMWWEWLFCLKEVENYVEYLDNPIELDSHVLEKEKEKEWSKRKATKLPSSNKKLSIDAQEARQDSRTPIINAWQALELANKFGVSVIGDETPDIRRITRSLIKEHESRKQSWFKFCWAYNWQF